MQEMGWVKFGFIFVCVLLSVLFFALAFVVRRSSRKLRKKNLVTLVKFQLQPKYLYDLRSSRMFMQNKNKNVSLLNPEYFKVKKNVDSFLDEKDLFKTMEECVFNIFKDRSTTKLFDCQLVDFKMKELKKLMENLRRHFSYEPKNLVNQAVLF